MRKTRATQQQRIANLEQTVYVLALRIEQLNKRIDDTQDTTDTDTHDNEQQGGD
jgi:predicted  nucleic acid-binding Zn-ribbon protein